ncbi:hypothetical protein Nepgr_005009 [Nepenthes gracilis]|uniref:Uncharacterized protein n=1 Tax=Nepenthes gracilis TaxID=150966 RepID=A0AAD3S2G4_NEPGR|nr:hypothetical protein Nepgr_005009 [Nepenthes gracilis]
MLCVRIWMPTSRTEIRLSNNSGRTSQAQGPSTGFITSRYSVEVNNSQEMVLTTFNGVGIGFGFGVGCGFGVGWGFGGMPLNVLGLGAGGGCGVGLGLGWGFGAGFGSKYRTSGISFQGIDFDNKKHSDGT